MQPFFESIKVEKHGLIRGYERRQEAKVLQEHKIKTGAALDTSTSKVAIEECDFIKQTSTTIDMYNKIFKFLSH